MVRGQQNDPCVGISVEDVEESEENAVGSATIFRLDKDVVGPNGPELFAPPASVVSGHHGADSLP
jgi:hypothetical protein